MKYFRHQKLFNYFCDKEFKIINVISPPFYDCRRFLQSYLYLDYSQNCNKDELVKLGGGYLSGLIA